MPVLINFKICDNAKECGGVGVCPTGALSYDNEKETIVIDNNKCTSCGLCERECPIGEIIIEKNEDEYKKLKEEIDNDKRTTKDLFVDRYGASPLSEFFMIDADDLNSKVNNKSLTLIECYNDDSIQCLLKSIQIKEITKDLQNDTLFYKVEANNEIINKYSLKELPSLLLFKEGKLLGKIEGYYEEKDKEELFSKLENLLK